jgi:hypothetical protein
VERQHAACHHAYKQLLVGWFAGVYHAKEQRRARQTLAPAPTAASACLQGGLGATGRITPPPPMDTTDNTPPAPASRATAHGVERGWERRCMQPTHHPPPASRATARGVECGWNNGAPHTVQRTTRPSLTSHCSWGGLQVERRCTQPPASNNAPPTPSLTSHCSWGGDWRPPLPIATAPTTTATSHCSWGGRGAMREVVRGRGCFPLESSGIAGFQGVRSE